MLDVTQVYVLLGQLDVVNCGGELGRIVVTTLLLGLSLRHDLGSAFCLDEWRNGEEEVLLLEVVVERLEV